MTASDDMQQHQNLTVTGRYYPPSTLPSAIDYGQWTPYTWNNNGAPQDGVRLVPQQAPWRALFVALDAVAARFPDEPVTRHQEADAIVACCWLHGSYIRVLASGENYPPFRQDRMLSRISEPEMMRINLEFSSGLATWLSERTTDPSRINRRVRAACDLLAMPWRDRSGAGDFDVDDKSPFLTLAALLDEEAQPPAMTLREEANSAVVFAYRNGPIEGIHGGTYSLGSEVPGFKRLYAAEVRRLGGHTAGMLRSYLVTRDFLNARQLSLFMRVSPMSSAYGWSVTDETSAVCYPGLRGLGSLDGRLRSLAERCSEVYGR